MVEYTAIFDFDGVIAETGIFHENAWIAFSRKYRPSITDQELRDHVFGRNNPEALEYLFGRGIIPEQIEVWGDEKEALFRQEVSKGGIKTVDGLVELLKELQVREIPRAIATTASTENVDCVIDRLHLRDYFPVIIDASYGSKGQADPARYKKAADKLDFKDNYGFCIVFEDSPHGSKIAKDYGMKVVAITNKPELFPHADLTIKDFTAINTKKFESLFHI